MICEKCGGACYLADVKLIIYEFGVFRHRHGEGLFGPQGLQKTFKCLECGAEIEVPPRLEKPEGHFVEEGDMLVWKPGKREEGQAEGVR